MLLKFISVEFTQQSCIVLCSYTTIGAMKLGGGKKIENLAPSNLEMKMYANFIHSLLFRFFKKLKKIGRLNIILANLL